MGYTGDDYANTKGNDYADDEDYDYEYNNNSYPQQSVQMKPNDEWIAPPHPTNKWDEYNNNNNNSTMQMNPDPWVQHPSHYNKPLNTQMKQEEWIPPPHKQTNTWGHHPNNTNGDNTYNNGSPMRQTKHDQRVPPSPSRMPMNPDQWIPPPHETIKGNDSQYYNNNMLMNPDYRGSPPPRQSTMQMRPDKRGPPPPRQPAGGCWPTTQMRPDQRGPPPPRQPAGGGWPTMQMRPDQRGPPPPRQPAMQPNQQGCWPTRQTKPNQLGQQPPRQTRPNQQGQPPPKHIDIQMNPGEWAPPPPKHNYHQDMPGYGDSFEGQQYDNWNNNNSGRNGYPSHGNQVNDYQFPGPMEDDAVEASGGYGAYQGGQQQPQYHYEQNKGDSTTPEWNAKGVKD